MQPLTAITVLFLLLQTGHNGIFRHFRGPLPVTAPTHFYKLDEASGNAVDSASGTPIDLTASGAPGADTTSPFGHERTFVAASSQYFLGADAPSFRYGSSWSIAAWVKLDSVGSPSYIAGKSNTSSTGEFILFKSGTGHFASRKWTPQVDTQWAETPSVSVWYFIAVTYDGTSIRTYTNGIAGTTTVAVAPTADTTSAFGIGSPAGAGGLLASAHMARVMFWNSYQLTQTEIDTLYVVGLGGKDPVFQ